MTNEIFIQVYVYGEIIKNLASIQVTAQAISYSFDLSSMRASLLDDVLAHQTARDAMSGQGCVAFYGVMKHRGVDQ